MPTAFSNPGSSEKPGLFRRIISTDHKVIGRQYFFLSLAAVLAGAWLSLLMRLHLVWPKAAIPFLGEIKPENYLAYLTLHGTLMVFFVLSTVPQSGFGTFFLPLQLGASRDGFSPPDCRWLLDRPCLVPRPDGGIFRSRRPLRSRLDSISSTERIGFCRARSRLWEQICGLQASGCSVSPRSSARLALWPPRSGHRAPGMTWMRMPLRAGRGLSRRSSFYWPSAFCWLHWPC